MFFFGREKYFPFPENPYGLTEADALGFDHLYVLFGVIGIGVVFSIIVAMCELGSLLRRRKYLTDKPRSGEKLKRRRASI